MSRNKQTFIEGALILVVSSLIVKAIGAIFKIPLIWLLEEDGMGLFNSAYTLFTFFVLASKGISIAISKMVSASVSLGKEKEADRIFSISLILLGIIGVVGTSVLYFAPVEILRRVADERAIIGIRAISPAVLFIAFISAFLGYFQGKQNMLPTALTDVIEALGKMIIGTVLAWWLINRSTELAAAGAVFGVTSSTFIALIFIVVLFLINKKRNKIYGIEKIRTRKSIAKELLIIALPITVGVAISSLTTLIDMATIYNRLRTITEVTPEFLTKYANLIDYEKISGGIYSKLANQLYGLYTGYPVILFNLPLTLVVALSTSVLPAISGAVARHDDRTAQKTALSVVRMAVLFSAPCAIGLSVLAGPILKFLFNYTLAESLLRSLSIAIIFVSVVQVTNSILQGYGKMHIPLINMMIGCVVKLLINYFVIAIPSVNIDGAPIGTNICYFTIAALNIICIIRITGCKFGMGDFLIKPAISVGAMAVIVILVRNALYTIQFNDRLVAIPPIAAGGIVYVLMIFLSGAVNEGDILMMPKGREIAEKMKKFHLLRR